MAETVIRAGAVLDVPTRAEMTHDLNETWRAAEQQREREFARGIKWIRYVQNTPDVQTHYTMPGPEPGYVWKLRRHSAVLTGADSVSVYIGDGSGGAGPRLIGFAPAVTGQSVYIVNFSPEEILFGGEQLYMTTSGSFRFTSMYLSAWQVPEEMQWKLL